MVSEETSFEIMDGRRTDDVRRPTESAYTISGVGDPSDYSSHGAFGSGKLKKVKLP